MFTYLVDEVSLGQWIGVWKQVLTLLYRLHTEVRVPVWPRRANKFCLFSAREVIEVPLDRMHGYLRSPSTSG